MVGLIDVLTSEIENNHDHYKSYITGDWKQDLIDYKLNQKFDSDIVDLLLYALANSTSTSCYVVDAVGPDEDVQIKAVHPTRPSVVAGREIFISKIGQHYDPIVDDKFRLFSSRKNVGSHDREAALQYPQPVTPLHMTKGSSYSPPVQLFVEETDDEGEDCRATRKATNNEARQNEVIASKSGDIGETSSHSSVQSPPCQMNNSCGKVRSQETTAKHLTEKEDKQQRRMKRIKYSVWDEVLVKNVDALPYHIDGNCIYQLPYSKNDRLASSRDGRPWKKAITSNTKELPKGSRKIAKCKGSYECSSSECMFCKEFGKNNTVNFDSLSENCVVCRICKMPALFRECSAVKVWEFQDHYVLVKHTGVHTCHPVPLFSQRDEQVKENVEKRLDLPPKRIQREAMLDQLYSGKTIKEVKSTARAMIDTKKISSLKRIQSQSIGPFGHCLDALKRLKLETQKTDKYYIFDIGDAGLSANKTAKIHVFKMSKIAAKIAIDMDKECDHFMAKEYCFFDGNHKRCRGFVTLGCYVYHPLLRKIIRLASMEVNVEDSEAIQIFWTLFNEVIAEYKGDPSYKFNPLGWCADEAGSNWEGLFRVFGDVRNRIVSCVFHYRQSVNRFSLKLPTTKEQEKFKLLSLELQEAATEVKYSEIHEKLTRFIKKKKHREQLLLNWFEWWHKRRANVFNAFKPVHGAPRTNWSEAFHSSWSHSSSINLSLVDAAYHDIVDAIPTEVQMQEIGSGAMAPLRGPDEATREAREFEEQKQRAKEYASTIQEIAKNLESAAQSFTVESDSTHRPDKRRSSAKRLRVSIQHVRARAEEIRLYSSSSEEESQQSDIVNNRSKRRRTKRSKRFNQSLNRALTERFAVTSYKKDGQGIYCSVRGLQDTYLVTVNNFPSCTCPDYMYRPNNSDQICKHLIWTYVNVIGLSEDDESIHQVFLNSQELKRILKKAPTEATNANASVSAPSQSLQDARFSSRMLP